MLSLTNKSLQDPRIDHEATDGLLGVANSLAYRIAEVERHLHSYENWFETAAVPNPTDHVADRIGDGAGAFQIDAGNDDWGAWVQVLGANDTPARVGMVKYDFHRIHIEASEVQSSYFVQIATGVDGPTALAAGTYTEFVYTGVIIIGNPDPIEINDRRADVGSLVWATCKAPGVNTATLDFYVGIHEYEG